MITPMIHARRRYRSIFCVTASNFDTGDELSNFGSLDDIINDWWCSD